MHEIFESKTTTTVALASEKIIARNKISRVAEGRFFYRCLHLNAKYYSNRAPGFTTPSVPYCSFSLVPIPSPLIPFVFLHPSSPPFDSISFIRRSSLPSRSRTQQQLRRPWDKRLHFLIFKCAQTSYPAIVCPMEALPRRGFRADKPFQPSMHGGQRRCILLLLCSRFPSLSLSLFRRNVLLSSFSFDSPTLRRWTSLRQFAVENANRQRESNGYEIVRDPLSSSASGRRILCYNRVGPRWPSFFFLLSLSLYPNCTDRQCGFRATSGENIKNQISGNDDRTVEGRKIERESLESKKKKNIVFLGGGNLEMDLDKSNE